MSKQKYAVNQVQVDYILNWIKTGEIAIPEIQRPFVWSPVQVRKLMDSLYKGYPVGYIITWLNPNVRLKDGSFSAGKKILIDGQQRITALRAAILGENVLDNDYKERRIKIAFNPLTEEFEVLDAAIARDKMWIHDISEPLLRNPFEFLDEYTAANPDIDIKTVRDGISKLTQLIHRQIGVIELQSDIDIETATEIFVRINDAGVPLSQADFVMSKIAADAEHGGQHLRKTIDYFCHLAIAPHFVKHIQANDKPFAASEEFKRMKWLQNDKDDLYDPTYVDMLRVSFGLEFKRAKLADLVALLSGRNFETRTYEKEIIEDTFLKLKNGVDAYMSDTHFKRFLMIIRSAGFRRPDMIRSSNAINFAYMLYLMQVKQGIPPAEIERTVKRWFVMSILTARATGSFETQFDRDIKQIDQYGAQSILQGIESGELSDVFWETILPQSLDRANASSPILQVFLAAQSAMGYRGFLGRGITITELLELRGDIHHIFPKAYMKKNGRSWGDYNQVANLVLMQQEINIKIGASSPEEYMQAVKQDIVNQSHAFTSIKHSDDLLKNLDENAIPHEIMNCSIDSFDEFLTLRRRLMSRIIRRYYDHL